MKIQICVDFDPFNFVLLQTDQIGLSQPSFPKQSREYVKQNGIPVIVQFIYGSSMLRQIIVDSPNVRWDRSVRDHLLRLRSDGRALFLECSVKICRANLFSVAVQVISSLNDSAEFIVSTPLVTWGFLACPI